ncbi:MAG TPA: DUF488 domain-containing protein [Flavipsychrobacter sp.]|nr:DUF488 domain-containing protein [Flavipsychrobacter sp.]
MKENAPHTIFTIGHSTRSLDAFIAMLHSFQIQILADIRSFPGSRKYPHFNKPSLEQSLHKANIQYIHLPHLGGRRKPNPNSINNAWRNQAFKGYADYMETNQFKNAIAQLEHIATTQPVAYMCSEAVWWRCHRALVSDYLKVKGWKVLHIMSEQKATEHPFTQPARQAQGKLFYD